ncbi:MAG TPA: EAL domain-containing protein [Solirubrobacteraceae bacterium]|nr:EAL domain-containing protein [Solirubrobacteraceae bacterium]
MPDGPGVGALASRHGGAEDLRRGLEAAEVVAYYQPQVDVLTGAVVGAEALARWQHPQRGLVAPSEFISLAERENLIAALTIAILGQAVSECHASEERGWRWGVSVNVASHSLLERGLVDEVVGALNRLGLPPSRLTLEITESALMEHPERTKGVLAALRSAGVRISIDDFGMGYSSLGRLHQMPVDELKVDRSFVADLRDGRDPAVLQTIISLGRRLGHRVVAEGIEDERDLAALASMGCQVAQGFWLAPPLAPEAFVGWLEERRMARPVNPVPQPRVRRVSASTDQAHDTAESLSARLHGALSKTLTSSRPAEEASEHTLARLGVEMGARAAVWWAVDQTARTLQCQYTWQASCTELSHWARVTNAMSVAPGVGVAGKALQTGMPAWASQPSEQESYVRTDAAQRDGLGGPLLAFPVTCDEQQLGVIELWDAPLAELVCANTDMLLDVGHRLGEFIQRRVAECDAHAFADALRVLRGSLHTLSHPDNPVALRSGLCAAAREIAAADVVLLWEPTLDGSELCVTSTAGRRAENLRTSIDDEASNVAAAFKKGQPRFIANVREDALALQRLATYLGANSAFYQPIRSDDQTIAVLVLTWQHRLQRLTPSVPAAVEILADRAARALLTS